MRSAPYPTKVPTIVFTGGNNDDTYANTPIVEAWVKSNRESMKGVSCAGVAGVKNGQGGRHELDNEAWPMGARVRIMAGDFLAATAAGTVYTPTPCTFEIP